MKDTIPEVESDYILWQRFKKGDRQAFIRIYTKYYPPLLVYGMKIKSDHELVKDSIQEMFMDIMSHIENLGDIHNILYYLITCLRRKIFRKIQCNLSSYSNGDFYFQTLQLADDAADDEVFSLDIRRKKKELMRRMINHLSPRQKEALLMKFYLNMDYKDIAAIMGLNIQSVRNLIHKGIKTLRVRIKDVPALLQSA